MVVKKKKEVKKAVAKKASPVVKTKKPAKEEEVEEEGGSSLDDAFADDDDVTYAESKPQKIKAKDKGLSEDELEEELDTIEKSVSNKEEIQSDVQVKSSKPIAQVKKGDKISIDGKPYEVDAHYVLIDHGSTKEMALEVFDAKADKDYQVRYFSDQVNATLELYELQDIMYVRRQLKSIAW